jgi:hypothetical protein
MIENRVSRIQDLSVAFIIDEILSQTERNYVNGIILYTVYFTYTPLEEFKIRTPAHS